MHVKGKGRQREKDKKEEGGGERGGGEGERPCLNKDDYKQAGLKQMQLSSQEGVFW